MRMHKIAGWQILAQSIVNEYIILKYPQIEIIIHFLSWKHPIISCFCSLKTFQCTKCKRVSHTTKLHRTTRYVASFPPYTTNAIYREHLFSEDGIYSVRFTFYPSLRRCRRRFDTWIGFCCALFVITPSTDLLGTFFLLLPFENMPLPWTKPRQVPSGHIGRLDFDYFVVPTAGSTAVGCTFFTATFWSPLSYWSHNQNSWHFRSYEAP